MGVDNRPEEWGAFFIFFTVGTVFGLGGWLTHDMGAIFMGAVSYLNCGATLLPRTRF